MTNFAMAMSDCIWQLQKFAWPESYVAVLVCPRVLWTTLLNYIYKHCFNVSETSGRNEILGDIIFHK